MDARPLYRSDAILRILELFASLTSFCGYEAIYAGRTIYFSKRLQG